MDGQVCVEPHRPIGSQHDSARFAVERGLQAYQLSIDICCKRSCSAANQPNAAVVVNRRDRWTDGRTDTRPLHIDCVGNVINSVG